MKQITTLTKLWSNYKMPVSDIYRKVGDICLIVGVIGGVIISEFDIVNPIVGKIVAVLGVAGKLLCNFNVATRPEDIKELLKKDATN
tara:strand:- start:509 stop:769 length:261 start_codon:yes stop_codon:yes gene_type:complete